MPDMNGYQVFKEIKRDKRTAGIPVIFVTALNSEADEIKGLETGAVDYVTKPIYKNTLKARINNVLELIQYNRVQIRQLPEIISDLIDPEQTFEPISEGPETPKIGRATILQVVNDPVSHELIEKALGVDYDLIHLRDGNGLMDSLKPDNLPQMILLDTLLPGLDGFEIMRRLKSDKITAPIPIIFITELTSLQDETKGFQLGCVDYVTKPISQPILKARVRIQLELSQHRRQFEQQLDEFV
ncbi:MAG: response regulator [SAR324 cluster bacterium]|nr:response regulator [SAR324 cluster bacterium]